MKPGALTQCLPGRLTGRQSGMALAATTALAMPTALPGLQGIRCRPDQACAAGSTHPSMRWLSCSDSASARQNTAHFKRPQSMDGAGSRAPVDKQRDAADSVIQRLFSSCSPAGHRFFSSVAHQSGSSGTVVHKMMTSMNMDAGQPVHKTPVQAKARSSPHSGDWPALNCPHCCDNCRSSKQALLQGYAQAFSQP